MKKIMMFVIAGMLMFSSVSFAQESLNDSNRANFVFDVDLEKLRKDPLLKMFPIEAMIEEERMLPPDMDIKVVSRIYGAVRVPNSIGEVMRMGPDSDVPADFFVRIIFNDSEKLAELYDEIAERARKVEKDGKTYLKAPEGEGGGNLAICKLDDKTVEVGTESYLYLSDRKVATKPLMSLWSKSDSGTPIRFAGDLDSARKFIKEFTQMAMEEAPMGREGTDFLEEAIKFVNDISQFSVAFDPSGNTMLKVVSESKDAAAAEKVAESVNGLLYLARVGGKVGIKQMPIKDKKAVGAMVGIVDQLRAKQSGKSVAMTIDRPDGFDDAVKGLLVEVRKAQIKTERMNNFRQFAIAIHIYHDSYRQMPFNVVGRSGQNEDLSWRVRILPFMEFNRIYEQMDVSEGWDSETNKAWASKMPKMMGDDGKNTRVCWVKSDVKRFSSIRDGTSNTIMLIENPAGVPWTQNKDVTPDEVVKMVQGLKDGQEIVVAMYDASCRMIDNKIDSETLKALLTPNGGEVVYRERASDRPRRYDSDKKAAPRRRYDTPKTEGGKKVESEKKAYDKKR